MAFGFGFNKAKVLNSAEKHVQQGKIQNAISDYEKVLQHDPKDLAILNTLGDLYARVGDPSRAASYFKRVGDAYAAEGFTVKAIALYKKLTKINPSGVEEIRRLGELYTQQNLLSDARQQYLMVADQYTKANRMDAAIGIFQKMLEFDPENVAMQTRLAELYVRMGKKDEAQEIFFSSAKMLQKRGSAEGADEALTRVLTLSPGNSHALLMRAQLAVESGNNAAAIRHLESIPNIDSNSEGLTCLLRARLAMAQPEEAEPLARKLLAVHDDLSGINQFADWLASRGQVEAALRIYAEYSDRLLASNQERLLAALRTLTDRVKENATALELILGLLQRAGEQGQITEVIELLAHALVQRGDLARARDYYRDLSVLEPENPVHEQNYRQIVARLGQDSVVRSLSTQEGGRAFMADELEGSAPVLEESLDASANSAVEAALTESELLDSYNLHPKAIATLESALTKAARSARLHQRLASAYAHSNRFEDAARSCDVLAELFEESGNAARGGEYRNLAGRYRKQDTTREQASAAQKEQTGSAKLPSPEPEAAQVVQEAMTVPPSSAEEFPVVEATPEFALSETMPAAEVSNSREAGNEFTVEFEPDAAPVSLPLTAEPTAAPAWPAATMESAESQLQGAVSQGISPAAEEIEIDISEEWQPASQVSSAAPEFKPGTSAESDDEVVVELEQPANSPAAELLEEIRFYISQQMWEEAAAIIQKCASLAMQIPELPELRQQIEAAVASTEASGTISETYAPEHRMAEQPMPEVALAEISVPEASHAHEGAECASDPVSLEAGAASEFALPTLEIAPPAASPAASGSVLENLAAGLEDAIPADLAEQSASPMPTEPQRIAAAPVAAPGAAELTSSGADAPNAPESQNDELDLPAFPETVNAQKDALSELFEEFKLEAEQAGSDDEDPESHYSLGVAFREMGLLDEAIGELQKVARNIETRRSFRDTLQVYTLLGQCFLDKGVPEAAVRWYEKALSSASDGEARVAVHYELGSAHEAAGSRPAALKHFMEVYGANIDYRDVAERIRGLKS